MISTDGLNIVTCRVHGDVIERAFSALDVTGGLYEEKANNSHFIWVNDQEIRPGDEITVSLREAGSTSHAGKTIDELYPEEEEDPVGVWPPDEVAHFQLLAQLPRIREGFRFRISPPKALPIECRTDREDHYFGFSVLWDWTRPTQARVSLHSSTLEDIRDRKGGTNHAQFFLNVGDSVTLAVLDLER